MQTITFSSIKGGVGKSSLAILTANILAATGAKILFIDADPQNSATFYYQPDNPDMKESLANILSGQAACDNIINNAGGTGIDLIPSSLELINRRNDDVSILISALAPMQGAYDYCIIDTAPNFDNVVINCLAAADKIVTPVQFSTFDFKSALFYQSLLSGMGLDDRWGIIFNKFKPVRTGNSLAAQYLEIYSNTFGSHIFKSRIPENSLIKQYFDTAGRITKAKSKMIVFDAITDLVTEITGNQINAEAF